MKKNGKILEFVLEVVKDNQIIIEGEEIDYEEFVNDLEHFLNNLKNQVMKKYFSPKFLIHQYKKTSSKKKKL